MVTRGTNHMYPLVLVANSKTTIALRAGTFGGDIEIVARRIGSLEKCTNNACSGISQLIAVVGLRDESVC
ncbi:hypothetical protein GCM10009000_059420 [Halobacterium noricense]|uniref:Uncharacterized protein n=1 Tax=Haladaptatus pallidirubidus TaxID=1008152 RepID=A0AAV3UHF0_9EURY